MARVRGGSVVLRMVYRRACLSRLLAVASFPAVGPGEVLPLCLGLGESYTLGVVADRLDVDKAAQIELF